MLIFIIGAESRVAVIVVPDVILKAVVGVRKVGILGFSCCRLTSPLIIP